MKTLNCWLISCLEVLSAILFLIFWGIQCGFSIYSNLPKSQMGYLATLKCMFVYNKDGRLCLDTYHPAQRVVKREDYVDSIIKVVNKFNVKQSRITCCITVTTQQYTSDPFYNGAKEIQEQYMRMYQFDYKKSCCSKADFEFKQLD